jgi:GT2 family glycosyltransferase
MRLSIIIVNYNSAKDICQCLATACRYLPYESYEWIIADNSSDTAGRQQVMDKYPFVRWIDMGYNAGFARANNAGIREAGGDALLLLNPDTLLLDDAIAQCFARLAASDYIACGVQLLNADHTPQISGNYFIRGGINTLLPVPYLGALLRRLGYSLKVKKTNVAKAVGQVEVDWINGAFIMVKKSGIEKAGMLDEDFFLYAEEIEWCGRLRKAGKLCIYGDLHVVHLEGQSANAAFDSGGKGYYNLYDRKGKQIMLSNFVRVRKQFGAAWFLSGLCFYLLGIPVFGLGLLLSKLFRGRHSQYSFAQLKGYCANVLFIAGKAFIIIRNKPYFYKVI